MGQEFEAMNERKEHYRTVDDDTIVSLKKYYRLDDHGELLRYVKENVMKDDVQE